MDPESVQTPESEQSGRPKVKTGPKKTIVHHVVIPRPKPKKANRVYKKRKRTKDVRAVFRDRTKTIGKKSAEIETITHCKFFALLVERSTGKIVKFASPGLENVVSATGLDGAVEVLSQALKEEKPPEEIAAYVATAIAVSNAAAEAAAELAAKATKEAATAETAAPDETHC